MRPFVGDHNAPAPARLLKAADAVSDDLCKATTEVARWAELTPERLPPRVLWLVREALQTPERN